MRYNFGMMCKYIFVKLGSLKLILCVMIFICIKFMREVDKIKINLDF